MMYSVRKVELLTLSKIYIAQFLLKNLTYREKKLEMGRWGSRGRGQGEIIFNSLVLLTRALLNTNL